MISAFLELSLALQAGIDDPATSTFTIMKQSNPIGTTYNWNTYDAMWLRLYADGYITMRAAINGSIGSAGMIRWVSVAPATTLGTYYKLRLVFQSTLIEVWNNDVYMGSVSSGSRVPVLAGTWNFLVCLFAHVNKTPLNRDTAVIPLLYFSLMRKCLHP